MWLSMSSACLAAYRTPQGCNSFLTTETGHLPPALDYSATRQTSCRWCPTSFPPSLRCYQRLRGTVSITEGVSSKGSGLLRRAKLFAGRNAASQIKRDENALPGCDSHLNTGNCVYTAIRKLFSERTIFQNILSAAVGRI